MASAPVVIPYAMTQLAEGVSLNAATTSAQVILTCPNGCKLIPMYATFRDAGAAVNAATTLTLGNSNSATAYLNASSLLQSMATTTGPVFQPLFGSSVGSAVAYLTGSQTISATFGGTLTSNGVVKCDVLGFISFF